MKLKQLIKFNEKERLCALLIILTGILIRIVDFGNTPCGFNQDEAFAGYEAFSLLNYGIDSAGYHNPCYFVSWGSGMNVLESYLAIPFFKLFGCSVTTFRVPQLILSCISLPFFYLLLKKASDSKTALLGLSLLVISPWHIMISRWGLESNLAPAFLLIGFYFFIKGINKNKYWVVSAIIYGLSLYSYSITWIVVPLTILVCGIYLFINKQKILLQYVLISGFVLFVFAMPLILFLLVNTGFISEISNSFISIPQLSKIRLSEISINNIFLPKTYYNLFKILINQHDGLIWNSIFDFGLFYKISLPFIILGAVKITSVALCQIKLKKFCIEVILLLGMSCSLFTCLLIDNLNVNKANSLHFYILIMLTIGIKEAFSIFKKYIIIKKAILFSYAMSFIFFFSFYLSDYNNQISYDFRSGLEDAVQFAKQLPSDICLDSSIYYSQVLFYDQTPTDVFLNTVEYSNYTSAFLHVEKFSHYEFGFDPENLDPEKVYIIKNEMEEIFLKESFKTETFENYSVAYNNYN